MEEKTNAELLMEIAADMGLPTPELQKSMVIMYAYGVLLL